MPEAANDLAAYAALKGWTAGLQLAVGIQFKA